MNKQNKNQHILWPNWKVYSKAAVIKTACYWHQDKCTSKWRRTENPEKNPHICNQPIFRGAKRTPRKGASFQEVVSGQLAFICEDAARSLPLSTHTLFNTGSVRSRGHFQPHLRKFPESAGKPQQQPHSRNSTRSFWRAIQIISFRKHLINDDALLDLLQARDYTKHFNYPR